MGSLYSGTSVSGYNANPPPDDGTQIATNEVDWSKIKTKLGDPLNTFASTQDASIVTGFGKTLDGATVVSTAVDYAAGASDQGRLIVVTVAGKTVTTPDATVVNAPFAFAVNNQSTGTITIDGSGTQNVDGSLTQVIQAGSGCILKTDGSNWFTYGLKAPQITTSGANWGFTEPINLKLVASVNSNILTVAVKTGAGADPSPGDPVLIPFRDSTLANGGPIWVTLSSALSITTNAVGATLGTQNSVPFRFWVLLFNNGGTPVLALWHSGAGAATLAINPLAENTLQSTTGISAAATSAGVFYTPNGTTLSSKAFRIAGFLDYSAGLATAGTYASAPTTLQLYGPGISKPGHVIQKVYATATTATTTSGTTFVVTNTTASITPSSTANLVHARASGNVLTQGNAAGVLGAQLGRTSNSNLFGTIAGASTPTANSNIPLTVEGIDAPGTTSTISYSVFIQSVNGSTTVQWIGTQNSQVTKSSIVLEEIMG